MSTKKIVKQLKLRKAQLEEHMETREAFFEGKSEFWQLSQKGEQYDFKTGELAEAIDYIDEAIEALNNFHS